MQFKQLLLYSRTVQYCAAKAARARAEAIANGGMAAVIFSFCITVHGTVQYCIGKEKERV
jgi:hypothetical protein